MKNDSFWIKFLKVIFFPITLPIWIHNRRDVFREKFNLPNKWFTNPALYVAVLFLLIGVFGQPSESVKKNNEIAQTISSQEKEIAKKEYDLKDKELELEKKEKELKEKKFLCIKPD